MIHHIAHDIVCELILRAHASCKLVGQGTEVSKILNIGRRSCVQIVVGACDVQHLAVIRFMTDRANQCQLWQNPVGKLHILIEVLLILTVRRLVERRRSRSVR